MRLSHIRLAGFKSFVDPTVFKLPSNLVGIVGPNGCGKSNVIDSVRWVMGEASAKHLRGESMADVIFNGSTGRKPVGQAMVELAFDNSDGSLGGEYARFSEITVRRSVNRDGVSNYYLNGVKCRRKDILDIFLGTGLGPRSYAIIEQGTISRLIEAKPEELRVYLEEVAGISRYKERRRETENRMRHTEENLDRLADVRTELEKQLNHLKRQAQAAERYKAYREELNLFSGQLHALNWQALQAEKSQHDALILQYEVELEAKTAQLRAIDAKEEELRNILLDHSEELNTIQSQYYSIGGEIKRIEQEIHYRQERTFEQQRDLTNSTQQISELSEQAQYDDEQLAELRQQLLEFEPEFQSLQSGSEVSEVDLKTAEQELLDWQQQWDEFNSQSHQSSQQAQVEQTKIQQFEQRIQNLQQRQGTLTQEQSQLDNSLLNEEINELEDVYQEQQEDIKASQLTLEQANAALREQREQAKHYDQQLNSVRSEMQSLQGKQASLVELQQAALGKQDEHAEEWLAHLQLADAQRLGQKITTEAGWETAVETVLNPYLQAICVNDLPQLTPAIVDQQDYSFTFISQTSSSTSTITEQQLLKNKITCDWPLHAWLDSIYYAENNEQAQSLLPNLAAHESIITKEGIWFGKNWIKVASKSQQGGGVLKREQELVALAETIANKNALIANLQEQIEASHDQTQELEAQREQQQQAIADLHQQQGDTSAQLKIKQARLQQMQQRANALTQEIDDISLQVEDLAADLLQARQSWQQALSSVELDGSKRQELLAWRDEKRKVFNEMTQKANQNRDRFHTLNAQIKSHKTQIDLLDQNKSRVERQLAQLRERQQELTQLLSTTEQPIEQLQHDLQLQLQKHLDIEEELSSARERVNGIEEQIRQIANNRHQLNDLLQNIRNELEQSRLIRQTLLTKSDNIEEHITKAELSIETLLAHMPEHASISTWQQEISSLETKIQRLGAINLAAIEEFDAQNERKQYLDEQHADLVLALETLQDAIRKIDRETRDRLQETYDTVNAHFQELFPKIFGGGSAAIELTGTDLLEAGITVMARPPGKKNSTIHLLSGGEKALTAIALVFALFRLNPAPFCMLDEVDAPLDDVNVGRFCRIVQEMSSMVQFIVISHNKITMEMANQLTGVTMSEPGVSRLVAVDVEEALKFAEA